MGRETPDKAEWAFRPGEVLAGKYRLERELGQGGMGRVVAATHLVLDQLVALKFIRPGVLEGDEAVRRFVREARAAARLKSENVARVLDVATLESGEPYMVMEYLDGVDLHAVSRRRGALTVEEASEYILQACAALAEAHAAGIVHRDIKPANLFLTRGPSGIPCVKVLDFGISKAAQLAEVDVEVTTATSMLGSPRFMAPEQMVCARDVDHRADIWSLGVILYKLVSATLPFEADTLGGLFQKVMYEPLRPLSEVRAGLPPGFEAVVARCLEKEPDRRFANVRELAEALAPFAPPRARGVLERIALHVGATERPPELAALYSDPGATPAPRPSERPRNSSAPTGTAAPWATGSRNAPARAHARTLAIAAGGIVALGLLCGTALVTVRANRATAVGAQPPPPAPATPTATPPTTATAPAPPTATATATASTTSIPTIAVTDAPLVPATKKPGKPGGARPPKPPPDPPAPAPTKPGLPDTRE